MITEFFNVNLLEMCRTLYSQLTASGWGNFNEKIGENPCKVKDKPKLSDYVNLTEK